MKALCATHKLIHYIVTRVVETLLLLRENQVTALQERQRYFSRGLELSYNQYKIIPYDSSEPY